MLRVHAAFARVRARLAALRPDAIAVVAGDHVEAFFLDRARPRRVRRRGAAGAFGCHQYRFPIHEPLARAAGSRASSAGSISCTRRTRRLTTRLRAALHDAEPAVLLLVPSTSTLPAAPADAAAVLRVGARARRDPAGAPRAHRADGLRRPLALPRDRPLCVARLRLRPPAPRRARRRPRSQARGDHRRGARQGGQCRAAHVDHRARRGGRGAGRRVLLRAVVAPRQRGRQ